MNFGIVGFDPGHFKGHNIGPGTYLEGDAMLALGLMLQQKGFFITRTGPGDVSFPVRASRAKMSGCNTLISLHTNAPEAAKGIIIFYSVKRPADKELAEYIGQELSKATGINFRGAKTRPSETHPGNDYYGMIRNPVNEGIDHVFIIEHGSHWEMAAKLETNLKAICECYTRIFKATETLQNINVLFDNGIIIDKEKWLKKANNDSDVYWLIKKMVNKLKG